MWHNKKRSGETVFVNDMPSLDNKVFGVLITANVNAGSIISGFGTIEAFVIVNRTFFQYYFGHLAVVGLIPFKDIDYIHVYI